MKRLLTIIGARPQFIKSAAISHVIREKYTSLISEDLLHTGQHYDDDMSGIFFTELDLQQPKYNLGIGSGTHAYQTAAMMKGIEEIMLSNHYDGVLIYGDTNSTLAGALAAAKINVPVYHVEAGLRSFNRSMPEEINRIVADHVSTGLFAPTKTAVQNLLNEGFKKEQITFSGDVMLDNVQHYSPLASQRRPLEGPFILATVHRNFNVDNKERLKNILSTLNAIAERHNTDIVFPIHPRTRHAIDFMKSNPLSNRIKCTTPFSYLDTLGALQNARLVLTDSGGIQKEAYFCQKPCVVLRPETEWVEIVDAGAALLADADPNRILEAVDKLIDTTPTPAPLFGNGHAAEIILSHILEQMANT